MPLRSTGTPACAPAARRTTGTSSHRAQLYETPARRQSMQARPWQTLAARSQRQGVAAARATQRAADHIEIGVSAGPHRGPAVDPSQDPVDLLIELAVFSPTRPVAQEILLDPQFADYLARHGTSASAFTDATTRLQVRWLRRFVQYVLAERPATDPLVRALHRELAHQWLGSELAHSMLTPAQRAHLQQASWEEILPHLRRSLQRRVVDLRTRATPQRNEVLRRALERHGLQANHGYDSLRQTSRRNVERILAAAPAARSLPRAAQQAVDETLRTFRFLYAHNTRHFTPRSPLPLLSSLQMERLSTVGGANSQAFNKRFLGSDDNVFFRVLYGRDGQVPQLGKASEYGDKALTARQAFLQRNGWISAFVMYPQDLQAAAAAVGVAELQDAPVSFDPSSETPGGLWDKARRNLHRLDFTVPDFEHLLRTLLGRSLAQLHHTSPEQFERTVAAFRTGSVPHLQAVVDRLVLEPLRLPHYWELKVPVSIPTTELTGWDQPLRVGHRAPVG